MKKDLTPSIPLPQRGREKAPPSRIFFSLSPPGREGWGERSLRGRGRGLFCLLLFLFPSLCFASVTVDGRVDRTSITVGDPITYTLTVRRSERDRVVFPDVGGQFGDLEVREVRKPEVKRSEGGAVEEVAVYIVTSYTVGAHDIPALDVGYIQASGDTGRAATNRLRVTVQSVIKPGEEKALKDVKPPVDLVAGLPWWAWLLILLALAGVLAYFLYRRRKRRPAPVREAPPKPIDELGAFDEIAAMGLLAKGEYKQHYSLASDALRRYIERRYRVEAMERTTWEIVAGMRQARVAPVTMSAFEAFLSACDLVKFAKYLPPREEMEGLIDRAKEIVRATMIVQESPESRVSGPGSRARLVTHGS